MSNNYLNPQNLKNFLFELSSSLKLDTNLIKDQISKVKQSQITYLPIKHHSPGSSILVRKWIERFEPKLVLIEGPSFADNLIQFITAKDTYPPIAILSMFTDLKNKFKLNGILSPDLSIPAKFEVYYPFVSYSPELAALNSCIKKKTPVHFIDLPITGLISFFSDKNKKNNLSSYITQEERIYKLSKFYEKFIEIFEFGSFNEAWETLFEINAQKVNIKQLRENILIFCSNIRQSINTKLLEIDGTLFRESYMKHQINIYIQKYKIPLKDVLVITGGIHSVALNETQPKHLNFPINGIINSLIPFSYYRMSHKSGYIAGNNAPQFYDNVWEKFNSRVKSPYEEVALETIVDIFKSAREDGHLISISDSINAFEASKMLGMLRRRIEPGLKDIIDSIFLTLIKGDPQLEGKYLEDYIYSKTIGYKVGKVSKKIGRLPLQNDFYLQLESLGIDLEEKSQEINLNLREDKDIKISFLFWRIKFLGVGMIERAYGPDLLRGKTGIFKETWSLHWTPNIDVKLVQLSSYGSTVEQASKNKLVEEVKKNLEKFEKITTLLFQSLLMGFSDQIKKLNLEILNAIDKENEFLSLSEGFFNLIMTYQYLSMMEGTKKNKELIEKIINRCYYACCFILPNFANPPTQDEKVYVLAAKKLANSLNSITDFKIDLNVFIESIKISIKNTDNSFIKGSNFGILYLLNSIMIDDIKKAILEYIKSVESIKIKVGNLIRGIIFVCHAKILFNKDIINLLSNVVENLEWKVFIAILPTMRKTFSELEPREYEVFVERLAEFYGLKTTTIKGIKEDVEDNTIIFFKKVDKKVKAIFKLWFGEI